MSNAPPSLRPDPFVLLGDGLAKRLQGGGSALEGVSIAIRRGSAHAVFGPARSGKSTLLNLLGGFEQPTAGCVLVDGQARRFRSMRDAVRCGIGLVRQEPMLMPSLTVARAFMVADGDAERRSGRDIARDLARRFGVRLDPDASIGALSVAGRRQLAILKAVHRGTRVLLLDEPMARSTPSERDAVLDLLSAVMSSGTTLVVAESSAGAGIDRIVTDTTWLLGGRVVDGSRGFESTTSVPMVLASPLVEAREDEVAPERPRLQPGREGWLDARRAGNRARELLRHHRPQASTA